MHILGAPFLILILGRLLSFGDVVGAWLMDRKLRRAES